MNIIVVDKDALFLNFMEKSLTALSINSYSFAGIKDALLWLKEDSNLPVDFIFITFDDEEVFRYAIELKTIIKNNSLSTIFIINEHDSDAYIKAIKYGDGYLLKPFSADLLLSMINYQSKRTKINGLLEEKNKKLLDYKKLIKQEFDIVEKIFAKQCENHLSLSDNIRFHISPASVFNGDVLLVAKSPTGSLYLAVGDVTGHGLPAAIGAMPIYSTFRTMAKKGKSIGLIAGEMNKVLRGLLPDNMMMALSIMEIDFSQGKAFIWSGGMPDIIMVNERGEIVQKIISRHAPLTVLDPDRFRRDVDVISLDEGHRLFLYTDGIEEARNDRDEMFGSSRFQSLFSDDPEKIFSNIVSSHDVFTKGSEQHDDITLVEIVYWSEHDFLGLPVEVNKSDVPSIPWRMEFSLTPSELRKTDAVAQIINFFDSAIDLNVHQDCISTVLAELYSNALEHGLLGLDSAIKRSEDGFVEYYIERQQRLSELQEGTIDIIAQYRVLQATDEGVLTLEITDSGKGFNYDAMTSLAATKTNANANANANAYGRGIGLLHELCSDITYSNNGRTAKASYRIKRYPDPFFHHQ
jgi:serine phosphatase RsbU (regulator of sigma subunit)/anti-sigma regulatory factor (Ser/Thr protein kinase)